MSDNDLPSTSRSQRGSRLSRFFLSAIVLLFIVAGGLYVLDRQGVDVGGALDEARSTSEDALTTASVKTALALSQRVSAFDIAVDTSAGIVQLSGDVPSSEVRELAVAIARDTAGVEQVDDRLRVEPGTRPSPELERLRGRVADLEIQVLLDGALSRNPALSAQDVRANVESQRVTLQGSVEDPNDKYGAETIAKGIEGVREVANEIMVTSGEDMGAPPEKEKSLVKRVEFELFASDAFNMELIEVAAVNGSVTLTGRVRSQAEKLLAERIVREVDGVDHVVNRLDVLSVPRRAESSVPVSIDTFTGAAP